MRRYSSKICQYTQNSTSQFAKKGIKSHPKKLDSEQEKIKRTPGTKMKNQTTLASTKTAVGKNAIQIKTRSRVSDCIV